MSRAGEKAKEKAVCAGTVPFLVSPEELYALLPAGRNFLLLLDYDGTLVPYAPTPGEALPGDELVFLLNVLAGRPNVVLAILSGRSRPDLEALLPVAGAVMVFCHGAVIAWPGGRTQAVPVPPGLGQLFELAAQLFPPSGGFLVENKGHSLAVHYRLADPVRAVFLLEEFKKRALPSIIKGGELEFLEGEKVLEVRPAGVGKGRAAQKIMAAFPAHYPVCLGDDTTDEDAFEAVGEKGVTVLVREEGRPSRARYRLAGFEEARRFLKCFM